MAKIHAMMDIGKRAMMNSQSALQTVAHNIANKGTEGYSRQRVDQVTAPPVMEGKLQFGMGSRAAQVTRVNNSYLDKQINGATERMGFVKSEAEMTGRVEQVFNEQQHKALNTFISDFFNAFRELSNNPESTTIRTVVKETGEALAKDFGRVDAHLTSIQKDADFQVKNQVTQVNDMTREIADLNSKIVQTEIQGGSANDQRDRRDLLVKKISEIMDVHVADGSNGMISLSVAGNALLVTGVDHIELQTRDNGVEGRTEVYAEVAPKNPANVITSRIKGGSMGGLIAARDGMIEEIKGQMDNLALNITQEVNAAHQMGVDRRNQQGLEFFTGVFEQAGAARAMKVNSEISRDVNRVVSASRINAPGDNTTANVIANIQYDQFLNEDTATIDDYYNSIVGRIGVIAAQANRTEETQGNLLQQMNTLRESVSGVSLDEEATKMLEHQKTFDASARLIRTADEMFDTVLNLKRL